MIESRTENYILFGFALERQETEVAPENKAAQAMTEGDRLATELERGLVFATT